MVKIIGAPVFKWNTAAPFGVEDGILKKSRKTPFFLKS